MFSRIKGLFRAQENPESSSFLHPQMDKADISQCPFMKNKSDQKKAQAKTQDQASHSKQNKNQNNASSDEQSEEEQPRGGCPFMNTQGKKKNPNLGINGDGGFDQPFISKFKFYLSSNKINFSDIRRGRKPTPIVRQKFDKFPIYLKHTLFYNGEDFKKVRGFECCSRFMAYEQLRERGNKYFNKGKFAKALDYYERSVSLFRWLQYEENRPLESSTQLSVCNKASQSQISDEEPITSEINFNFSAINQQSHESLQENRNFDQFEEKYKEFFTVYSDHNVKYCNGEEMQEQADIDMRKSLLIQLYLNMAATYINLNNFDVAHEILDDALQISDKVSQVYLRKAQATLLNKGAALQDLRIAYNNIQKAIEMRPNQKIFQNTNVNILKMVNIHDAEEVYNTVAEKLQQRIKTAEEQLGKHRDQIEQRLIHIRNIQLEMIKQGKTPREGLPQELLSNSQEYKILTRMHSKYVRILEFFLETKDKQQIALAKTEFQEVLRVLSEVYQIQKIQVHCSNPEFGTDEQKVENRCIRIKRQMCDDIYNNARYNFQVLEWAIKEIVNEEHEEKKRLQKQKQKEEGVQKVEQTKNKRDIKQILPYLAIIAPVLGIITNYMLL